MRDVFIPQHLIKLALVRKAQSTKKEGVLQRKAFYKGRRSTKEGALQSSKIHITLFVELFKANMKI